METSRLLSFVLFPRFLRSRSNAALTILTSGPFPDRNTAAGLSIDAERWIMHCTEAGERFTCSWNPCDETRQILLIALCNLNRPYNSVNRARQVGCHSVGDFPHLMAGENLLRRLDDI